MEEEDEEVVIGCDSRRDALTVGSGGGTGNCCGESVVIRIGVELEAVSFLLLAGRV